MYSGSGHRRIGQLKLARHTAKAAIKTATPKTTEYTIIVVSTGLRRNLYKAA
jgi:hypothetical protein